MNKYVSKIFLILAVVSSLAIIAVTVMALAVIGFEVKLQLEDKKIEVSTQNTTSNN